MTHADPAVLRIGAALWLPHPRHRSQGSSLEEILGLAQQFESWLNREDK